MLSSDSAWCLPLLTGIDREHAVEALQLELGTAAEVVVEEDNEARCVFVLAILPTAYSGKDPRTACRALHAALVGRTPVTVSVWVCHCYRDQVAAVDSVRRLSGLVAVLRFLGYA